MGALELCSAKLISKDEGFQGFICSSSLGSAVVAPGSARLRASWLGSCSIHGLAGVNHFGMEKAKCAWITEAPVTFTRLLLNPQQQSNPSLSQDVFVYSYKIPQIFPS